MGDQPAAKGIDNTILAAGDAVEFSFKQYTPDKHKGSLLATKRDFQARVAAPKQITDVSVLVFLLPAMAAP